MTTTAVTAPAGATAPARAGRRNPWIGFLGRRLVGLAAIAVALVVVTFAMVQLLPGDPAVAIAGGDATAAEIEQVRTRLGLDRPLWLQFWSYVSGLATGDLGTSFMYNQPVATIIANRLPFTVTLALAGIVLVLLLALPLGMGVGVATRGGRRGWLDAAFGAITGFFDAIPGYVAATGLVMIFALGIGVIPILPPAYSPRMPQLSFALPVTALAIGPLCTVSRVVRRETGRVLGEDYMRTARSWRLPVHVLYLRHALPNILTTTLTLGGLILGGMLGGALIIEAVFAIPGLGSGMIRAILDRDFPVIQGLVLVVGLIVALVNLLVDVLLAIIDPRNLGGHHGSH